MEQGSVFQGSREVVLQGIPPLVDLSTGPFTNWMYPVPQPVVSPWACPLASQKYPIPFVSPSLDWLAWLGLASLASVWLVSSAAATTTATTLEQAFQTTVAGAHEIGPVQQADPNPWLVYQWNHSQIGCIQFHSQL